jgi:outer membrane murein-binding lipoprotein Lpp
MNEEQLEAEIERLNAHCERMASDLVDIADDHSRLFDENARLKAEVERLTALVGADAIDREHGMCCDASAQVERLTKAGDAMAEDLLNEFGRKEMLKDESYQNWLAAKEGKPRD